MILEGLRRLRDALPFGGTVHRVLREPYYRMLEARYPRGAPTTLSNGQRIRIRPRFLGMRVDIYEPEVTAALLGLVGAGDTVIDIGAHVGLHSLMLSRAVGPGGRVIAIEPSPANAAVLRQHLDWNGCDNATVIQAAVSDQEGEVMFAFRADASDAGSFANSLAYDIGGEKVAVPLITLDSLGQDLNPSLIKIDVEGAELNVLRGAEGLLARTNPVLLVAIHPEPMRSMGASPRALVQHLRERGYVGRDLKGQPAEDPGFEEIIFRRATHG